MTTDGRRSVGRRLLVSGRLLGCLVCLFFLLSVLSVGVSVAQTAGPSQGTGLPTTVEDIDELPKVDWNNDTTTPLGATETVVIELRGEATEKRLNELRSRGASVELTHETLVEAEIRSGEASNYTDIQWVERVRKPIRPVTAEFGEGAKSIGADEAHSMGITGEGTSVAVIDAGFQPDNERISDNIAEQKAFGTTGITGIIPRHGTASAEMVVDVAPDADLYIATVSTDVGYMNAIDWATENDVDVITTSLGFSGLPNDGTSDVSQKSDEAVEDDDVVFTASAGNSARLHWQGDFSDTRGNDLLEFESGEAEVNFFTDRSGNPTELTAGSVVRADLTWDDWETVTTNYNLHLVRVGSPGEEPEIVRSADTDAGFEPVKRIQTQVLENGFYGVMVEQTKGTDETVEIFADSSLPGAGLQYKTPESSVIAPSTAEEVMGIGAFRYDTGDIEPYSSRGPTNDGRRGVSVAAPTCSTSSAYSGPYCGTSGAAPHAGGVAALTASASASVSDLDLGASEVRNFIEDAADDTPESVRSGGDGAINASGAVEEVTEEAEPDEPVTVEHPATVITDGNFEVTVEKGVFATAAIEAGSSDFGVDLSVADDGGDSPTAISENRIEFIDIDKETSTYVLDVNVTGGTEGDTGEITAYVGGNADSEDNDSAVSSTFSVVGVTSSPVGDVSDELWTAVTQDDGGDGLSLSDLGNAIQEYQESPGDADVGGVSIGLSDLGSLIQYYRTEVA